MFWQLLLYRRSRLIQLLAVIGSIVVQPLQATSKSPSLFDGHTFDGWTSLDGKPVGDGWEIIEGVIHRKPNTQSAGHIITKQDFGDMDLSFEWKIATAGNSGLKYRVHSYEGQLLGCEYQIVDDKKFYNHLTARRSTGALYGLFEPNEEKRLRPPGESNASRVVTRGDHLEHWLNGKKIVDVTVGSNEWNKRVKESKFSDLKAFARNPRGKIMLTDHGSEVWYRNFRLQEVTEAGN